MINLSTRAYFSRATSQITSLRAQANELQYQTGSGEKLARSSQDPVAAARLRTLARTDRLATIDQTTSDRAMHQLRLTDSALDSIAGVIFRTKELTMLAASSAIGSAQLTAIRQEIDDLRQTLLTIANGHGGSGHALFGGQGTGAAYIDDGSNITYAGTMEPMAFDLGEDQQILPGLTGPEVFAFQSGGVDSDLFAVLGELSAALQGGSPDPVGASLAAMDGLDAALERVTTGQTIIGARMAWIELMSDRREATGELRAEERNAVGGADLALTITRLHEVMTVLEASQASFVRLSSLSLFNVLR